jgi:hypothetical protein
MRCGKLRRSSDKGDKACKQNFGGDNSCNAANWKTEKERDVDLGRKHALMAALIDRVVAFSGSTSS